ncbi:MAG: HAAS signaling domain-containing protein [Janthinobacterium lividum]
MHSLLEDYLSEVAAHLNALPKKRRAEELAEMRTHLLNAATVSQELGQSEEDAVANAVQQFGTPEDLGENLVWAWRREDKLIKRSFWGATLCSLAVLLFAPFLFVPLVLPHLNPLGLAHFSMGEWLLWLVGIRFAGPIFAGATTSLIFSKRTPLAGVYGPVLYFVLCIPASFHQLDNTARLCIQDGLVILAITWISSRGRLVWSKRKRFVRG